MGQTGHHLVGGLGRSMGAIANLYPAPLTSTTRSPMSGGTLAGSATGIR